VRYEELADVPCSITRPLVLLGDRWTLLVLKFAFAGVRRFNELQQALGIPRGRLRDRLERLVEHGILVKQPPKAGAHHEYRLTQKGHDLYTILMAVKDWGDTYMAPDGPPMLYRHRDCGGDAHAHLICDRCNQELNARAIVPEFGPGMP
jgi:DNA-binding HxlR family transcriptional regulator